MRTETKLFLTKIYLYLLAIGLLFWWPLSHWFYPDFYHELLGFKQYSKDMVTIIGTCGTIVVSIAYFAARDVVRNRDCVKAIIIFSVLMGFTYIYLIAKGAFPVGEYFNVVLCFMTAGYLGFIYPWEMNEEEM